MLDQYDGLLRTASANKLKYNQQSAFYLLICKASFQLIHQCQSGHSTKCCSSMRFHFRYLCYAMIIWLKQDSVLINIFNPLTYKILLSF
jgi:hypothetical protein